MKRQKKLPLRRRISLRGALIFTTLICLIGGISACLLELSLLNRWQNNIYDTYVRIHLPPETEHYFYTDNDGLYVRLEKDLPQYYVDTETEERFSIEITSPAQFIPEGVLRFFWLNDGLIQLIVCFLTAGVFFFLDATWFYRWKLKRPLSILNNAAEKIGKNDLDFHIEQTSRDELGKLCASFETMRGSLEKNNKDMWRAMEERRRLNAAFAHDLRTPLTVLQGYSDYLLEGLPEGKVDPQKAETTIFTMKQNLTRLQQYVESMNSIQKLEELSPRPAEESFSELCVQVRETAEILRGKEGFSFTSAGEGRLLLDQELFFRVFENLMSNAGRYAESRVTISLTKRQNMLFLSVSDDGPGFPPEALKRAIEPYYRGESEKISAAHTDDPDKETAPGVSHFGLGLTICKTLCEKHGGCLTLQNRPSGGACVTASFEIERLI